jgi:drug/metabolite transporter (DMT)-like permease
VSGSTDAGLALAFLSTTAYNSGLIVEKQALGRLPAIGGGRVMSFVLSVATSPRWLAGFTLMLFGLAFQVLALTLAPVTLVQPVIAGGVAIILVLSRLVLREQLGRGEYACVAFMALSVVLLALSADGTPAEVGHQVSGVRLAAVAFSSCLVALLAAASALGAGLRKHGPPASGVSYGIATGLLYGVAALAIKALSGALLRGHGITGTALAVLSSPYLYLMAACSAAGLLLFQTALQRCRISIVAPVSNVLGSIYFLVAGTWLFHERLPADPVQLTLRLVGIAVACCVVALLSRQSGSPQPEPHAPDPQGPEPQGPEPHASGPQPPEPQAPSQSKARRTWRKEGEAHGFRRDVA